MAERNPRIPHSIQSLLYVERGGKYCGYKLGLISDTISSDLKEFLICSECKGISRSARQVGANTVCEVCVTVRDKSVDERVENKVKSLNSKCPLSGNDCNWLGVIGEIEEHMLVCSKLVIQCELECGVVFERENTEVHNKEVCPLRTKECEYCKQQVQVNKVNNHKSKCTNHPDTEIPCPYKELGCDAIVLRKNKDIHLAENMIGHQKLMLDQLNQLRNRNQQLEQQQNNLNEEQRNKYHQQEMVSNQHKDRMGIIEASATNKKEKDKRIRKVWVIIELVLAGIAVVLAAIIGISVAASFANGIQYNSEQIQSLKESTSHISEYISERGKVLPGIEWIHGLEETGYVNGPSFYLKECNLRLGGYVYSGVSAYYYIQRLNGKYDDSISSCTITYISFTHGYADEIEPIDDYSSATKRTLTVGDITLIQHINWRSSSREVIIRAYIDTKVKLAAVS